ncbi:methyltransferase [Streptococcus massiliensis]|uniref:Methyltransferase n=2 Tax=Streptococcus massiliensis TaxID=313439 RepID=A0A380L0K3_9STRE|nr:methyltransferase [Streptococcus massiliensis]
MKVNRQTETRIRKGQVILDKNDFPNLNLAPQQVELMTDEGKFLASAYLAPQNKGVGWVIAYTPISLDEAFLVELFEKAKAKRTSYAADDLTTAYRVFNQEGDGFGGLTIDFYNRFAVFSWYNSFVYEQRELFVAAFRKVFPEISGAYEKIRFKGLDYESAHLFGDEAAESFTILENGVRYQVFLNDGLMTGIFLDQHNVRASLVDGLATGKNVLNMFSYTAAFSVAASMGGALATTSVDLAKRSRELSEAHFLANDLSLDNHRFVVMDVFDYFKYAKRHGLTYDVIILDPPSFARNKKRTFSVSKDYHKLVTESLAILNSGGILITSTNAANVSRKKFKEQIEKGLLGTPHHYLAEYGLPADFTYNKKDESSNYLKVCTIKVDK